MPPVLQFADGNGLRQRAVYQLADDGQSWLQVYPLAVLQFSTEEKSDEWSKKICGLLRFFAGRELGGAGASFASCTNAG
jgi:photosystem II stability/assembly factor-like uncharacterized protein